MTGVKQVAIAVLVVNQPTWQIKANVLAREMLHTYFSEQKVGGTARNFISTVATFLRVWDLASSNRVDRFIANSNHTRARVQKYYRRESEVLYPPVDTKFFTIGDRREDYYLVVCGLVPYKRVDLAVAAFNRLKKPLVIIGAGPERDRLKSMARHEGIKFLGYENIENLRKYYQGCKALIFPGEEDFGIVPAEAMACGRPVVAFGRGGALETVVAPGSGKPATGIHFTERTPDALSAAVTQFEKIEHEFDAGAIRRHALTFDRESFKSKLEVLIQKFLRESQTDKRTDASQT